MKILLIAAGGFLGAICRFFLAKKFNKDGRIPAGTLAVNLLGSFFLGYLAVRFDTGSFHTFFGIGFIGAFTTFSTLMLEIVKLSDKGNNRARNFYMAASFIGGLCLAFIGMMFGSI